MTTWPGDPPFLVEPAAALETHGFRLRRVSFGEHAGTHLCAPAGFLVDGVGVEAYAAETLVAAAVVLDARGRCAADPEWSVSVQWLTDWEDRHGGIPADSFVLLNTGWAARWGSPAAFVNLDEAGVPRTPGFGAPAADWLLAKRGVRGLGSDAPGIEVGRDATFAVNRAVLAAGGLVLECLGSLDALPAQGAWLVVGALRIGGGTGAPATVIALCP
jgi:kynurenine formamidase